jgi:hypothetical protein
MAKKLRIYVDTSVVGGCLDEEFREASVKLMDMFREGRAVALLSELLLQELRHAPDKVRRVIGELPEANIEEVSVGEDAERLQSLYLEASVVGGFMRERCAACRIGDSRPRRHDCELEFQAYRPL